MVLLRSMNGRLSMRVHLKGIHRVEGRLATGERRSYYYAWRGGPRISGHPGSPEFVRQYQAAHASLHKPASGSLMSVITAYKGSADYQRLAASTIRAYASYIKLVEAEFGDLPLAALQDPRVRG